MSFWNLSDGTNAAESVEKEYDAGGGFDNTPLPKGTSVLVMVEEAVWKAGYQVSEEFVNLKCRVLKPEGYANRVLWFKLWVGDLDPSVKDKEKANAKRDKARKMMLTIDGNAKGRLAKLTKSPTNDDLALALTNAQFVASLGVWDKEDENGKKVPGGNWLMAARPKSAEVSEGPAPVKKRALPTAGFDDDLDDEIPF